jgi:DNA-binding MltR family transcriptional regulator
MEVEIGQRQLPREPAIGILNLIERSQAGQVLVAAGILDEVLQQLLLYAGRKVSNKLAGRLFEGYGPLSSFSAKIDIAYLFRHLSDEIYSDLRAIKDIRNCFAHAAEPLSLSSPEIVEHLKRLRGWTKEHDNVLLFWDRVQFCLDEIKSASEHALIADVHRDFSSEGD